jgi:hypothetical protein
MADSKEDGHGYCYLTYDGASNGTMYLNWKQSQWSGDSWAYIKCGKPVAKFKFTNFGGKSELLRDCAQAHADRQFTGWTHFVKLCKDQKGELIINTSDVKIYLVDNKANVSRLETGKAYTLDNIEGVAAVGKDNSSLDVQGMEKFSFLDSGRLNGAALEL